MALPEFNMRQLLEAGVHFGHQTHRWNPKMAPYIYGERNKIHIIDLTQTVPLMHQALKAVSDAVAAGGRILFVGTKRQASDLIADAAKRSAQYYVNHRWLGGTLTNWQTISRSIARLRDLEEVLEGGTQGLTKKELLQLTRERDKLERALGGIKDMGGTPDLLFVIDTNKEQIAIKEAQRLGIPVAAILDSNCDPDNINHPIPGNDDAGRAITFYCDLIARAAVDGISRAQGEAGADIGEAVEPPVELAVEAPVEEQAPEAAGAFAEEELPAITEVSEAVTVEAVSSEDKFVHLESPRGAADDLKKIGGLGPVLEQKLNDLGIYHYWQIAALTPEDVARIDEELSSKGRIERDHWIGQAKALAEGAE